ncbi:hypothetical protein GQ607_008615 [Colletotrichum asianum]|uniref:Translation initiation factor IF-2 n=1 Tax=Colletotrichum asianum TaxID=702518 RepID=A0A8H3WDE5_9PEZI|nr:hypothetical protein GQ607_008615 [Colletotrichum asianum]
MKANVIAATILAAFSAGAFAQDNKELPTGFPTQVPGAAQPSGGFPGFGGGFPSGFGGARPTQVPGAAQPSGGFGGGFGGGFPGFGGHHGAPSGFETRINTRSDEAAGFGAAAAETGAPTGTGAAGARPTGKGKGRGKGKNHGTGIPSGFGGARPTQVPGAAQPSGGFGGGFPGFGGAEPTGSA